jgi:hypothetical protein
MTEVAGGETTRPVVAQVVKGPQDGGEETDSCL